MLDRLFDVEPYAPPVAPRAARALDVDDLTLAAISEAVFEARCLALGFIVARQAVDMRGVDRVVNGWRVQVKSTRQPVTSRSWRGAPYYRFRGGGGGRRRYVDLARLCDVFAFYAHDAARFWILPAEHVAERWAASSVAFPVAEPDGLDAFDLLAVPR